MVTLNQLFVAIFIIGGLDKFDWGFDYLFMYLNYHYLPNQRHLKANQLINWFQYKAITFQTCLCCELTWCANGDTKVVLCKACGGRNKNAHSISDATELFSS